MKKKEGLEWVEFFVTKTCLKIIILLKKKAFFKFLNIIFSIRTPLLTLNVDNFNLFKWVKILFLVKFVEKIVFTIFYNFGAPTADLLFNNCINEFIHVKDVLCLLLCKINLSKVKFCGRLMTQKTIYKKSLKALILGARFDALKFYIYYCFQSKIFYYYLKALIQT